MADWFKENLSYMGDITQFLCETSSVSFDDGFCQKWQSVKNYTNSPECYIVIIIL